MSTDPALPPSLAAEIKELWAAVRTLQTANRLSSSSVRGGAFKVLDDDGVEVARIGRLQDTPFPVDGINITSSTGAGWHFYVGDSTGVAIPWFDHGWHNPADAITTTSGTFVETWRSVFELATSYVLKFRVPLDVPASTTAELRVLGPGDVQLGSDKSIVGASSATHEFCLNTGFTPQTGPITLKLQARRTAGAGTISVFTPSSAALGALGMAPVAGGWV